MSSFPMSLRASALALSTLLSSCSEPKQLSDYSTEDIVEEYYLRLDEFRERIATPFVDKVSSTLETSGISGLTTTDGLSPDEVHTVMTEAYEYLLPFAEAGDLPAMAFVGRHMMNDLDQNVRCEGYAMLRDAAVKGDLEALLLISSFYTSYPYPTDQDNEKLMFLWTREGIHRSPDLFETMFKLAEGQISVTQVEVYEREWIEWSPEHAPLKLYDNCAHQGAATIKE